MRFQRKRLSVPKSCELDRRKSKFFCREWYVNKRSGSENTAAGLVTEMFRKVVTSDENPLPRSHAHDERPLDRGSNGISENTWKVNYNFRKT